MSTQSLAANRIVKGVPAGGQFAATPRSEATVSLDATPEHTAVVEVPLDHINWAPMPHEDDMSPEWREEHEQEYAEYGGSHGYVQHLAESMKASGQREPVEVRALRDGTYDIWDGNHRVAAVALAGLSHLKATLVE